MGEAIAGLVELSKCKFVPVILLNTESNAEKKQPGKAAGATAWLVLAIAKEVWC